MSENKDPMTEAAPEFDPAQSSPERAEKQVGHSTWPKPGDEGYVHPDGTPQAASQLVQNQQAAADRAAAGSIIHGAPAVQHGGRADATDIAVERARQYGGPSNDDRDEALIRSVREGQEQLAQESTEAVTGQQAGPADVKRAGGQSNTDSSKPTTSR